MLAVIAAIVSVPVKLSNPHGDVKPIPNPRHGVLYLAKINLSWAKMGLEANS